MRLEFYSTRKLKKQILEIIGKYLDLPDFYEVAKQKIELIN